MKISVIIVILTFLFLSALSQTFHNKSVEELEQSKIIAVENENYELAAKYKKAIAIKKELLIVVETEKYEEAARLKEELKKLDQKSDSNQPLGSPSFTTNNPNAFIYDHSIGQLGCTDNNWRKTNISRLNARFYGTEAQTVFLTKDIIYYGIDISYSKLIDKKKIGEGHDILNKYADKYHDFFNELINPRDLQRWMKKESMMRGTALFDNYKQMDINNWVTDQNYCLSFSDIQNIVKSYSLKETDGLGMVINVSNLNENFNEKNLSQFTSIYITFFDIATRNILWAIEAIGPAAIPAAFWHKRYAIGANYAVRQLFIDKIYLQGITDIDQLPEKHRLD